MSLVDYTRLVMASPSPIRTGWILFFGDILAIFCTAILAFWLRYLYDHSLIWEIYVLLWPGLLVFPIVYMLLGLYPGIGSTPPEELRRLTYGTSLVMVVLGASTFMFQREGDYSRGAFLIAWFLLMLAVPLSRAIIRAIFAHQAWWGASVVILGAGKTGLQLVRNLNRLPGIGLKPRAIFDDDPTKMDTALEDIPVVGTLKEASEFAHTNRIKHAVVAMPGIQRERLIETLMDQTIPHLVLIPDLFGLSSLWVSARDFGGMLGLEIQQRLLMPRPKWIKRVMEISLIILASPLLLLVSTVVAVLVRVSSPGAVVFTQNRPGLNGQNFKILKFRTMYVDAEVQLAKLSPELRKEFEIYGKIQDDPRITPIGKWLRKLSLDEFPQFWNVVRGEMSLVGPRAYLLSQLPQMKDYQAMVMSVPPGITGLWQVSGRSEVTFEERLDLDAYYVRNWSPWLDIYILARTVWVVLFGKGAY